MIVNYYEIEGCECEFHGDYISITAPDDTEKALLYKYGFMKRLDGKWYKVLTDEETADIESRKETGIISFGEYNEHHIYRSNYNEEDHNGLFPNFLCFMSALLFVISSYMLVKSNINPVWTIIPALVLLIYTRIKYPKNILSKILIALIITGIFLVAAFCIFMVIACGQMCDSCFTECERCGSIG